MRSFFAHSCSWWNICRQVSAAIVCSSCLTSPLMALDIKFVPEALQVYLVASVTGELIGSLILIQESVVLQKYYWTPAYCFICQVWCMYAFD